MEHAVDNHNFHTPENIHVGQPKFNPMWVLTVHSISVETAAELVKPRS